MALMVTGAKEGCVTRSCKLEDVIPQNTQGPCGCCSCDTHSWLWGTCHDHSCQGLSMQVAAPAKRSSLCMVSGQQQSSKHWTFSSDGQPWKSQANAATSTSLIKDQQHFLRVRGSLPYHPSSPILVEMGPVQGLTAAWFLNPLKHSEIHIS